MPTAWPGQIGNPLKKFLKMERTCPRFPQPCEAVKLVGGKRNGIEGRTFAPKKGTPKTFCFKKETGFTNPKGSTITLFKGRQKSFLTPRGYKKI